MPSSSYSNGVSFSWIGCQLTYVTQNSAPAWVTMFASNHVGKSILEVDKTSLGHVCVDTFKVYPGETAYWDGKAWNLSYGDDLEYDFKPPVNTVRIPKCTCGVKSLGYGLCSDWCDLVRKD